MTTSPVGRRIDEAAVAPGAVDSSESNPSGSAAIRLGRTRRTSAATTVPRAAVGVLGLAGVVFSVWETTQKTGIVDWSLVALLGIGVALSEILAHRPRNAPGTAVSVSPLFFFAAVLLLGTSWAVLLGVASVLLGDLVVRRSPWLTALQRVALLSVMILAAGFYVAIQGDEAGALEVLGIVLPTVSLGVWAVVAFGVCLRSMSQQRPSRELLSMLTVLFLVLALATLPLWQARLPGQASQGLAAVMPSLMAALGFMTADAIATSTVGFLGRGASGLAFWKGYLAPTFYRYNGFALSGLVVTVLYQAGGLLGAVVGSITALLGLWAYRTREEHQELMVATVCAFTSALDAKDPYTAGHSERVASYALGVSRFLGLSPLRQRNLQLAGRLHDLGKIGVPDAVLLKPGRYTPEEFEIMKRHAKIGEDILWHIPKLRRIAVIVGQDHERWDGSGYPRGLLGSDLSLEARIIAVADVYDAMTTDRPYRPAMAEADVLEHLARGAGKEFDPAVVGAFIQVAREGELVASLEFGYCITH